ncbi:MAG TPA: DNA repair protein RadC [Candidatus Hydrothermia bacterium]|nr:DNA repair protein RadC [Candidatus Hydrothermae bacterium]MDD3649690.1 DNA repair protein RadC [Candidatus Hydrothermia bacterium]MDD5573221.1 DNA repair protein RadC [Candidatus Hydrothermia bacterium]HOK23616.1 DNA repair protein RadC [Candidatus Hydrothermia bacterium]HOL24334.1 DNA repair protein RadC [Candidatus Hydrothermia bacterium]
MKIKDLPVEARPREKLLMAGPSALKNYELLACILGKGTVKEDVISISKKLIEQYGNNLITQNFTVRDLQELFGLGFVQACQVTAMTELARRLFNEKTDQQFLKPEDVYKYCRGMYFLKKEHLRGLYLDVKNRLLRDDIISVGTVDKTLSHPREVFKPAIEVSAVSLVLVHNHPSGDPTPSKEDIDFTKKIKSISEMMEIELLDHIIIGADSFISLKELLKF